MMAQWFDGVIDNIENQKSPATIYLIVLSVLVAGAGSLYVLINTQA